jgi:iron(III) transport system ATP-binding protein
VALARALAPEPKLLLLDEPFNTLDLDLRRTMCEEIIALLRGARVTVILVTHDPVEAFATSDLVAVMQNGKIQQCDPPRVVYHAPKTASVARLTGPAIFLPGTIRGDMAETALGVFPAQVMGRPDGSAATVMLRPEQIKLTEADSGCRATVLGRRFLGDHMLLTVAANGVKLDVRSEDAPDRNEVYLSVKGMGVAFAPVSGTIGGR